MSPADDLTAASRRAVEHYRDMADGARRRAEIAREKPHTAADAATFDALAAQWAALADELEDFGATDEPHPGQGALL